MPECLSLSRWRWDIRDRAAVEAMVERAAAEFGPIDILVNCPAPREEFPFTELLSDVWQRTMGIVLGGPFNWPRYATGQPHAPVLDPRAPVERGAAGG